ncbi:MAG: hypothetical protein INR73_21735 [Williamsia sp.]|nr:hypothetical protein [Williamsia sp.]
MKTIFINRILPLAQKALVANLFVSLPVYGFILAMFHDFGFSLRERSTMLLKTVSSGYLIIFLSLAACKILLAWREKAFRPQPQPLASVRRLSGIAAVSFLSLFLYSCKGGIQPFGKKVDLVTGLTTSYKGIVPTETKLIMNNELLNHTDIPLGEKFTLVNTGVSGLTVKDDKVSVGCALSISGADGKQVLYEQDLFKTDSVFNKDSVSNLQCKVSTGAPMEWQKKYLVKVTYWDKYGTGKLENAVTISMEDEP